MLHIIFQLIMRRGKDLDNLDFNFETLLNKNSM